MVAFVLLCAARSDVGVHLGAVAVAMGQQDLPQNIRLGSMARDLGVELGVGTLELVGPALEFLQVLLALLAASGCGLNIHLNYI